MTIGKTIERFDWGTITQQVETEGFAVTPPVLSAPQCTALANLYDGPKTVFRSKVVMARHSFGRGEYQYFAYPLPSTIETLRQAFYSPLATLANRWVAHLKEPRVWPRKLNGLLDMCHDAGQARPTPLLLKYGSGDYNCLHQDVYGEIQFPFQVIIQLSDPCQDFTGGEIVLVEHRPRKQSRPMVVPLAQGAAAIIPVRYRAEKGSKGWRRTQMRHGVSEIQSGRRFTLGLIFHDAA